MPSYILPLESGLDRYRTRVLTSAPGTAAVGAPVRTVKDDDALGVQDPKLELLTRWLCQMLLPTFLVPIIDFLLGNGVTTQDTLSFELRHYHAVSENAHVVFANAKADQFQEPFTVHTRIQNTYRPSSFDDFSAARAFISQGQGHLTGTVLGWEEHEVNGPDVGKRETILTLAKMANNAYVVDPSDPEWYDLEGKNWTDTYPFGWEDDGFRGQVFATPDNSTVVVSIKGTSAGFFGGGGPTAKKDKLNDNLLFSCCCARVDWTWSTVCDCYRGGGNKCNLNCLEEALAEESLFYPIGTNLYHNITYMYPESNIWLIGHSLGGALASLLGATFGAPVVTIESPGEKMAAGRLHLPSPPSTHHITHIYHTADPIAMGTCNGVLSSCALGGFAMESRCHLGKSIIYDTVLNCSWAVDIRTHGIVTVIEQLLSDPWPPSIDLGLEVPEAKPEDDCVECYSWEFGDFP
ncbi:putative lipase atg15 [Marasmius crinis-equi]|uniref:triacylglycerol lipase n=1 Tax=Marasmius crinis-equi TaxID=585013 RepID=A0ABR3FVR6_9AGAR